MRIIAVFVFLFIKTRAGCDINFTADDRFDVGGLAGTVEIDCAVHHAVVGDGASGAACVFDGGRNFGYAAGAVKEAIFAVQMQMDEICHEPTSFLFSCEAACGGELIRGLENLGSSRQGLPPKAAKGFNWIVRKCIFVC